MSEWQPIETAPTDGTPVLATWMIKGERRIGVFKKAPRGHQWLSVPGTWSYDLTHWMPLPEPPK